MVARFLSSKGGRAAYYLACMVVLAMGLLEFLRRRPPEQLWTTVECCAVFLLVLDVALTALGAWKNCFYVSQGRDEGSRLCNVGSPNSRVGSETIITGVLAQS
jgi:hypothetical protein